jgi:topoisomerase (DNA) II binding protein 1
MLEGTSKIGICWYTCVRRCFHQNIRNANPKRLRRDGFPLDTNNILHSSIKALNGIGENERLCICLTGYQQLARRNIIRMAKIMKAEFVKPLVSSLMTHLVCYKYKGEKYELAKMRGIILVNHCWLEYFLKSWTLLLV